MPLTKKGQKVKREMKEEYGEKKGVQVFYASAKQRDDQGRREEEP